MMEGSTLPFGGRVSWLGNSIAFWVLSSVTVLCPCLLGTPLRGLLFPPRVCSQRWYVAYHSLQACKCLKNTCLKKNKRGVLFIQSLLSLFIDKLV